jgi:hypothetical protein
MVLGTDGYFYDLDNYYAASGGVKINNTNIAYYLVYNMQIVGLCPA